MVSISLPNLTVLSDSHSLKAFLPILVTPSGIVTRVSFEQLSKIPSPISVSSSGRLTSTKSSLLLNALLPIFSTLSGTETLTSVLELANADAIISVTGFPSIVEGISSEDAVPTYFLIATWSLYNVYSYSLFFFSSVLLSSVEDSSSLDSSVSVTSSEGFSRKYS